MKDGDPPKPISFQLVSASTGIIDENQKDVLSVVLKPIGFVNHDLEKIRTLLPEEGIPQTELKKIIRENLNKPTKKLILHLFPYPTYFLPPGQIWYKITDKDEIIRSFVP